MPSPAHTSPGAGPVAQAASHQGPGGHCQPPHTRALPGLDPRLPPLTTTLRPARVASDGSILEPSSWETLG